MSSSRIGAVLTLMALCLAASAFAQGLGDTAASERKKRAAQTKKPEAKAFTNDDLDKGRPPGTKTGTGESSASSAPAAESGGSPEAAPVDERQQQERAFLDGISAAQAQVAAVEARIRQLSGRLNPMSTDYIYGASGSNDANDELRVRDELRQAEQQLVAVRQAMVTASQNLQDFRSGRPTGSSDH